MLNNESKHLLLNWATRQRPGKFMKNLDAYLTMASGKHRITLVVSMDKDDLLCNNQHFRKFLDNKKSETVEVIYSYGESLGKIAAINRDIPVTPWDILISTADDMESAEQGWDDIIVQDMIREFPDMDGSLNYNNDPRLDEKGFKTLITLPIIGRKLYDQFGYVYHPSYKSEWCDNEQTEVFETMGVLRHINTRPIIHKWAENQDQLMHRNIEIGQSVDKKMYYSRKSNNFGLTSQESTTDKKSDMIVQITLTRNELFLIKEMLPIWKKYADAFIFMDDRSTDGTYEYLMQNKDKYNILAVLPSNLTDTKLWVESNSRQRLFDEAFKHSEKIICLDTDEYLDGNITKPELNEILETHKDTMFYLPWIQYVGENHIRTDGKWGNHPVDRIGSYSKEVKFKPANMHSEHIPCSTNTLSIGFPHLFVSHLQWLDKPTVALKQYYWKVTDYVNKLKYNSNVISSEEYDKSVNNFNYEPIPFSFPLKIRSNIYQDHNLESSFKQKFIQENISKYNIPNLNDWGMNIHRTGVNANL